jgi:chromosome segregation ATPase
MVLLPVLLCAGTLPADAPATGSPDSIIAFLNQTILWYRQFTGLEQLVNEPSDGVFLNDNRQIAQQVVRLSFEFARAQTQRMASQKPDTLAESNPSQYQNLVSLTEKSNKDVKQREQELESLKQNLNAAGGKKRRVLESAIVETEAKLELLKARRDSLQNILQFASEIDELARAVPDVIAEPNKQNAMANGQISSALPASLPVATSADRNAEASSIFGLISDVIEFRRKLLMLDNSFSLTDTLNDSSKALRDPLVANIKTFMQRGDELAEEPPSQDPTVLAQQRKELEGLTAQYKQLSAAVFRWENRASCWTPTNTICRTGERSCRPNTPSDSKACCGGWRSSAE